MMRHQALHRMRAHQIGHKILFTAQLFVDAGISLAELLVHLEGRLAHVVQGVVAHVLRRDLQLTGDVVLDQFAEERIVLFGHHVVVAQTGAHEHFLHALDAAQLTQQFEVIRVVGLDVLTGGGEQAALVLAAAVFLLLFAGWEAKIRVGPPTSWMYPLNPGICVIFFASSITLSWLRT